MRVLHITTWFPNRENPKEALWIKRHIDSLIPFCENEVWHIRTVENTKLNYSSYNDNDCKHRLIGLPTSRWFLIEIITFFQVLSFSLFHSKSIQRADVINFHIAYPSLTYWKYLKFFFKKKVVITEHWSAYHFNFGVKGRLPKIQSIFKFNLPVIAVSKALRSDIEVFSGAKFPNVIIPNVVDTNVFYYQEVEQKVEFPRFFMVSQWNYPKDPLTVIRRFTSLLEKYPKAQLNIGGYGNLVDDIIREIKQRKLEDHVRFIGKLSSEQIAYEMNQATAFIHLSTYETFSVVCAEAVCCGCPVLASNVGGIKEFIDENNGVLIDNIKELDIAFVKIVEKSFLREEMSNNANGKFSSNIIGEKYYKYLLNSIA